MSGDREYNLKELKKIFYQKKKHCKLDWKFVQWDLEIKKNKNNYKKASGHDNTMNMRVYDDTKKFLEGFKLEFEATIKTFSTVIESFENKKYPFRLEP